MQKIDTHQHFWKFEPVRDAWIRDSMQAIRRDFLPEDIAPSQQQHSVTGCIAVQAEQSEKENAFLLDLAAQHDFIQGIVGWADLRSDELEERLEYYRSFPKMKGFRHILQSEQDRALMLRPAFKRGISLLAAYGFTYDLLIFPDQLLFARELALAFPGQQFILDHIAKPGIRNGDREEWAKDIRKLAACPNVSCKLSGMITEASWKDWKAADIYPYIDTVVEAFGTKRILFGSDWPVCLVAGSYSQVVLLLDDYFKNYTEDEKTAIWYGNAHRIYNLSQKLAYGPAIEG